MNCSNSKYLKTLIKELSISGLSSVKTQTYTYQSEILKLLIFYTAKKHSSFAQISHNKTRSYRVIRISARESRTIRICCSQ